MEFSVVWRESGSVGASVIYLLLPKFLSKPSSGLKKAKRFVPQRYIGSNACLKKLVLSFFQMIVATEF